MSGIDRVLGYTPVDPDPTPRVGDFFHPDNWGYCKDCAKQVAYDSLEEKLFDHMNNGTCPGGGEPRTEQPSKEVERYAFNEIQVGETD